MLNNFKDITSRIKDPILWYDSNGVPRYDKFHPTLCPDIYANEAVLYLIKCQVCNKLFTVASTYNPWACNPKTIYLQIRDKSLHFGDPPSHDCSGDTMNCEDIKVLEYWYVENLNWKDKIALRNTPLV